MLLNISGLPIIKLRRSHLETETDEEDPEDREEHNENVQAKLNIAYSRVSKEEVEVLDDIIKQVGEKFPELKTGILKRT